MISVPILTQKTRTDLEEFGNLKEQHGMIFRTCNLSLKRRHAVSFVVNIKYRGWQGGIQVRGDAQIFKTFWVFSVPKFSLILRCISVFLLFNFL